MSSYERLKSELHELRSKKQEEYNVTADHNGNNLFLWNLMLKGPLDSPYSGRHQITLRFPGEYPERPPEVTFKTQIQHPNVAKDGLVSIDDIVGYWPENNNVAKIIDGLLQMLVSPNFMSPNVNEGGLKWFKQHSGPSSIASTGTANVTSEWSSSNTDISMASEAIPPSRAFVENHAVDENLAKYCLHPSEVKFQNSKEHCLSGGADGCVYKGKYGSIDIAVKKFHDNVTRSFLDEATIFAKVQDQGEHPNLLKMIGIVYDARLIITDFCPHGSLDDFLHKTETEIVWRNIDDWTVNIIDGMNHLHSVSITHRDLKPANILIACDWKLQIADFARSNSGDISNLTFPTGSAGTDGYMAPELYSGSTYTKKVDVWSFGVILWEICCRHRPFAGLSREFITRHLGQGLNLPVLKPLPEALASFISQCLSVEPKDRPSFAEIDVQWPSVAAEIRRNSKTFATMLKNAHEFAKIHRYVLMEPTRNRKRPEVKQNGSSVANPVEEMQQLHLQDEGPVKGPWDWSTQSK